MIKCKECSEKAHFLIPRRWCEYHWRIWWYKEYSINQLERILNEDIDCLTKAHEQAIYDSINNKIKEDICIDDINQ